jgi:hypothetical protein
MTLVLIQNLRFGASRLIIGADQPLKKKKKKKKKKIAVDVMDHVKVLDL